MLYLSSLSADPLIFDLGANHGEFSERLRDRIGGGEFKLFEPNPDLTSDLLAKGFAVSPCAVAGTAGTLPFHIALFDEGSSLTALPTTSPMGCVEAREVKVRVRTLREILEEVPRTIDVLKVDIEGAECDALRGVPSEELAKVRQITVEFHGAPLFGGLTDPVSVERTIEYVEACGFLVLDFTVRWPHYPRADVLFINRAAVTRAEQLFLQAAGQVRPRLQKVWRRSRGIDGTPAAATPEGGVSSRLREP